MRTQSFLDRSQQLILITNNANVECENFDCRAQCNLLKKSCGYLPKHLDGFVIGASLESDWDTFGSFNESRSLRLSVKEIKKGS